MIATASLAALLVFGAWFYESPIGQRRILEWTDPQAAAMILWPGDIRHPDPDIARIPQGPPENPKQLPTTPITPWDNSEMFFWMERMAAKWEDEITDPEILRMANEAETRARDRSDPDSFYRSAKAGIDLAYDSADAMDQRDGLYIMFKAALAGRDEPFVFHHLANYYEAHLLDAPSATYFRKVFWRHAADRDFLPSLVNIVALMRAEGRESPSVIEAYLRYGLDLNAEDGGFQILEQAQDFYLENPGRAPEGYMRKVVERYRAFGDIRRAAEIELAMQARRIDMPDEPVPEIDADKLALAAGDHQVAARIGLAYLDGKDVPQDLELARDYFVACLRGKDPAAPCAFGLGEIYIMLPEPDLPLAVAFWRHASEDLRFGDDMASVERGYTLLQPVAETLNDQQKAEVETDLAALRAGDYSALPGLKDARPVPELAGQ